MCILFIIFFCGFCSAMDSSSVEADSNHVVCMCMRIEELEIQNEELIKVNEEFFVKLTEQNINCQGYEKLLQQKDALISQYEARIKEHESTIGRLVGKSEESRLLQEMLSFNMQMLMLFEKLLSKKDEVAVNKITPEKQGLGAGLEDTRVQRDTPLEGCCSLFDCEKVVLQNEIIGLQRRVIELSGARVVQGDGAFCSIIPASVAQNSFSIDDALYNAKNHNNNDFTALASDNNVINIAESNNSIKARDSIGNSITAKYTSEGVKNKSVPVKNNNASGVHLNSVEFATQTNNNISRKINFSNDKGSQTIVKKSKTTDAVAKITEHIYTEQKPKPKQKQKQKPQMKLGLFGCMRCVAKK